MDDDLREQADEIAAALEENAASEKPSRPAGSRWNPPMAAGGRREQHPHPLEHIEIALQGTVSAVMVIKPAAQVRVLVIEDLRQPT